MSYGPGDEPLGLPAPAREARFEPYPPRPEPAPRPAPSQAAGPGAWVLGCHLSPLAFWAAGMPMLGFLGPLVLWLMKRDEMPEVEDQGREALNFQLTVLMWTVVLLATCIFSILIVPLVLASAVFSVIAATRTSSGQPYRYPGNIEFVGPRTQARSQSA